MSGRLWLPTHHCAAPVWFRGRRATPLVTRYFPPKLCHECYGSERAFFDSQTFFTLHSFLLVLMLPWGWKFNLKVSRASCWSSKHSPSPTIVSKEGNPQKKYTGSSTYAPRTSFVVRVPQPWNLPLTGLKPAFLKASFVGCRLS